ncbi:MAG: histidine kinase [Methylophaga sp.]|nr:MAG: histidine kinase [Methylophaga sp.]
MVEQITPFESLKAFSGIIHRQPIFLADRLDVDSYHLRFLNKYGQKLDDDSEVPTFISQLNDILPSISDRQKALLSIPESWQSALDNSPPASLDLILDLNGHDLSKHINSRFHFASHASPQQDTSPTDTLLIDIQQYDISHLEQQLPTWRKNHQHLCAINVDNINSYTLCQSHLLDLLQGQFYTLPSAKEADKILPSQQILMELLVKLQDPHIEAEDLANTINQDVTLSYKLLRLINSAFFGLPREVSSIKHAVVMLGEKKIKTWASLLCLSGVDDKPVELRVIAMTRARMCELLSKHYKGATELFFATGLFSTLDALMDKPLSDLLEKLPLSTELSDALLHHTGIAGKALNDVLNYEKSNWIAIEHSPVPSEILAQTYLEAINWAKELNGQL